MQNRTHAALVAAVSLITLASAVPVHDGDPKLRDYRPPHEARPILTHVKPGVRMASAGTPRAFGSSGILLLANLPLSSFGASAGNDCWGYTSPSGREYALFGHNQGTGIVEITDPRNPVIVANMSGPTSTWRDIKVYSTYAYAVSEGGSGIQVFDMSQVDSGVVTLANTITTGGATSTHNVHIDTTSGYLYRCGGGSTTGLRIYNLNPTPANPTYVSTQYTGLYFHDVQAYTYTSGPNAGMQVAFGSGNLNSGGGSPRLAILNVTNKNNVTLIREVSWPSPAFSHQCWLSDDEQYVYLDDELDEPPLPTTTYVFNVSNLATAFLAGSFTNGNPAIGHNNYVKGDKLYCANYRSGVRVFDRSVNPVNCTEVAWFDTYPGSDSANFNGLWSVYPFFPSGMVIGSDMNSGLFVWWVGAAQLDLALVQPAPAQLSPAGETLAATIIESSPGQYAAGTAMLNYDAGSGVVSVPMVHQGGSNFNVVFPALPCGASVSWYLSAESSTGMTWTEPEAGASAPFVSLVGYGSTTVASLDMETNPSPAWTVGDTGDTATSGIWVRVDPVGTAAQPEDDHTPAPGVMCWVTGQGSPGGSVGANDVDGGATTLKTAVYNLSTYTNPVISYWRWYSNNQNSAVDDTFKVDVTNGGAWVNVETVGPTGPESSGGWFYHEFAVSDFVAVNSTIQVRFVASDFGSGSIVEAAVDDFGIRDIDCSPPISSYCTAGTTANGCTATMSSTGSPSASAGSGFTVSANNVEGQKQGIVFYGLNGPLANPWGGGSTSYLCVKAPTQRTPAQNSGGTTNACNGTLSIDWNTYIATNPTALGVPFSAGTQVWSQAWFRDPPSPNTTSLSNGLTFTVGS